MRRHDVATLDAPFWDDPAVLRFGVADEVRVRRGRRGRAGATPTSPDRVITARHAVALAAGVVAVDLTPADDDDDWAPVADGIRAADGWRIARAYVSVIPTR